MYFQIASYVYSESLLYVMVFIYFTQFIGFILKKVPKQRQLGGVHTTNLSF